MIFIVFIVGGVLLSRRAARRTSRSQHSVLEIAASVGSHHRAFEGDHSAGGSAGGCLRNHGLRAADYGPGNQRRPHLPRDESGYDVGCRSVLSGLVGAALRSGGARALARADLRLAAAGFRVGAARNISLGRLTAARDWHLREGYVRDFALRLPR